MKVLSDKQVAEILKNNPALRIKGKLPKIKRNTSRSKLAPTFANNEHELQALLFKVLDDNIERYPFLQFIFAVPNGGDRHFLTAVKLKREGVRAGVPDVFVPFTRHGYSGLWIEHKYGYRQLKDEQIAFKRHLKGENYKVVVSRSELESIKYIEEYLGIKLLH